MKIYFLALFTVFLVFVNVVEGQVNSQAFVAAVNTQAQCTDSKKTDGTSDCAANAGLCNNASYSTFMTTMCPRTCCRCVNAALNGGVGAGGVVYRYYPTYYYPNNYYPYYYGKRK